MPKDNNANGASKQPEQHALESTYLRHLNCNQNIAKNLTSNADSIQSSPFWWEREGHNFDDLIYLEGLEPGKAGVLDSNTMQNPQQSNNLIDDILDSIQENEKQDAASANFQPQPQNLTLKEIDKIEKSARKNTAKVEAQPAPQSSTLHNIIRWQSEQEPKIRKYELSVAKILSGGQPIAKKPKPQRPNLVSTLLTEVKKAEEEGAKVQTVKEPDSKNKKPKQMYDFNSR